MRVFSLCCWSNTNKVRPESRTQNVRGRYLSCHLQTVISTRQAKRHCKRLSPRCKNVPTLQAPKQSLVPTQPKMFVWFLCHSSSRGLSADFNSFFFILFFLVCSADFISGGSKCTFAQLGFVVDVFIFCFVLSGRHNYSRCLWSSRPFQHSILTA